MRATTRLTWAWWAVSRFVLVLVLLTVESGVGFDLDYYADSIGDDGDDGVAGTLREYPVAAVLVLAAPYGLLALGGATAYFALVVIVLAVVLDGAFLRALLARATTRTRRIGGVPLPAAAWLVAVPAIGSISYARLDLLPGVLIGLSLLSLADAPRRAAVLAAAATGVKYWPALVLPTLAAPRASRRRVLVTGAATGVGLVAVSLALGGWDRLLSPLDYQGSRGLQIESVAATPAMVGWALSPDRYDVFFPDSLAWEVDGPGVAALITASTALTAVLLLVMAVLWALAWRRLDDPHSSLAAATWLMLAGVCAFIIGGKVLSPQYLIWLLPLACAGLALLEESDELRRLLRWSAVLLLASVLTHVVYPHGYLELIDHTDWTGVVVTVLVVRNVLLVGLCGYAVVAAARLVTRAPRRPRDHAAHEEA